MTWIPNVVSDTPIESSWGNLIRDRTVHPFVNAAERDAAIASPTFGMQCILQQPIPLIYWWDGTKWLGVERLIDRNGFAAVASATIQAPTGTYPIGFGFRVAFTGWINPAGAGAVATLRINRTVPSTVQVADQNLSHSGAGWPAAATFHGIDVAGAAYTGIPTWTVGPVSGAHTVQGALELYALGPVPTVVTA